MSKKKRTWKKIIRAAIEFHLPMWWDAWNQGLILRVKTGDAWNGREYTRKVMVVHNLRKAYEISLDLFADGAALHVTDLVNWPTHFDPYRMGWDPNSLQDLRAAVWDASRKASKHVPNWDAWLQYKRELKGSKDAAEDDEPVYDDEPFPSGTIWRRKNGEFEMPIDMYKEMRATGKYPWLELE